MSIFYLQAKAAAQGTQSQLPVIDLTLTTTDHDIKCKRCGKMLTEHKPITFMENEPIYQLCLPIIGNKQIMADNNDYIRMD
jgi:hypothetical protein